MSRRVKAVLKEKEKPYKIDWSACISGLTHDSVSATLTVSPSEGGTLWLPANTYMVCGSGIF